jgi:hypothetical protein
VGVLEADLECDEDLDLDFDVVRGPKRVHWKHVSGSISVS